MNGEKLEKAFKRLLVIAFTYDDDVKYYESDEFGDLDYPDNCEIAHNAGFKEGIMFAVWSIKRALRDE